MSVNREFPFATMQRGDKRVTAIKLECGKCDHVQLVPRGSTKTNVGPAEESQRFKAMFEREGWFVGRRANDDRCPSCASKLGIDRPKTPQPPKNPVMQEKMMAAIAVHDATKAAPKAAGPGEMSREDGRIIFAKIEDVYRDEKNGYENGWSDHRVATDLNVPRAWVEQVRKQFFGPEGGNEEIRQILAEAQALVKEHGDLRSRFDAELKTLANRAEAIQRRMDKIEQTVGR